MTYDEIVKAAEGLGYRDKFRLAQLLIQLARKEEEEEKPSERALPHGPETPDLDAIQYAAQRIVKLRPAKRAALLNSISAMFQFRGGISDDDREKIVSGLQKRGVIAIDGDGAISYPNESAVKPRKMK